MICAGRNWVATMILRALPILLLALPLAGCYSVTASKEIPAWAMSSGAESDTTQRRAVRRASAPRPPAEDTDVAAERLIPSDVTTINTGNASLSSGGRQLVVRSQPHRMGAEKPAATQSGIRDVWASDPADDELRRRMTICRGC
jgi:hypothetical protein